MAGTAAIGVLVRAGATAAIDRSGFALRGHARELAFFFTLLGRWPALTVLGSLAFGVAMLRRDGVDAVVALLATQVVSQFANSGLKRLYGRPRPAEHIGRLEREYAYPSGHSVTAIVFFLGFAIMTVAAPLEPAVRAPLCTALIVCTLGIPWSRIALGAHYVSDVAGGISFGAAWLFALLAIALAQPVWFAR